MAASQARFLGLTARKTNVEFEGQQINQQRTTLANQSANYYNDLLGMAVPTPPSVDNYTKTVYTFNDGALTNEVTALIAKNNGCYKVSYLQQWEDDFAIVSAATSIVNKTGSGSTSDPYIFRVGAAQIRTMLTTAEVQALTGANEEAKGKTFKNERAFDPYVQSLSNAEAYKLAQEEAQYVSLLTDKFGSGIKFGVRYVQNESDGTWKPYFYNVDQLTPTNTIYDNTTGNSQSMVNCYTVGSATKTSEVKMVDAKVEKDSTGRYINLVTYDGDPTESTSKVTGTYALTTSTITDQAAYEDAMNQYEFDKAKYDQAIQEINSKIEIVQAEDKNLELRLKQLDTEQDAISTEMDAVQKVIEKNTESSFKTFG